MGTIESIKFQYATSSPAIYLSEDNRNEEEDEEQVPVTIQELSDNKEMSRSLLQRLSPRLRKLWTTKKKPAVKDDGMEDLTWTFADHTIIDRGQTSPQMGHMTGREGVVTSELGCTT